MKTVISIPDETFDRVERRAAELGISRSQVFATAVACYLDVPDRSSLTARIDAALDLAGEAVEIQPAVLHSRRRLLADDDW